MGSTPGISWSASSGVLNYVESDCFPGDGLDTQEHASRMNITGFTARNNQGHGIHSASSDADILLITNPNLQGNLGCGMDIETSATIINPNSIANGLGEYNLAGEVMAISPYPEYQVMCSFVSQYSIILGGNLTVANGTLCPGTNPTILQYNGQIPSGIEANDLYLYDGFNGRCTPPTQPYFVGGLAKGCH